MEDLNKIYNFNNKVDLLKLMNMDECEKIYPLNTKVDILDFHLVKNKYIYFVYIGL